MDQPLLYLPQDTLRTVRTLVRHVPWRAHEKEDRGLRARYARWNPSGSALPGPSLLGPLWRFVPDKGGEDVTAEMSRAVEWAGIVLHLIAVGPEAAEEKVSGPNLGRALQRAGMKEARFVRLMHAPLHVRLESLSRTFRFLKRQGVAYSPVLFSGTAESEGSGYLHPIKDSRSDDLAALLTFLFISDATPAIARWSQGYFQPVSEVTPESIVQTS